MFQFAGARLNSTAVYYRGAAARQIPPTPDWLPRPGRWRRKKADVTGRAIRVRRNEKSPPKGMLYGIWQTIIRRATERRGPTHELGSGFGLWNLFSVLTPSYGTASATTCGRSRFQPSGVNTIRSPAFTSTLSRRTSCSLPEVHHWQTYVPGTTKSVLCVFPNARR